MSPEDEVSPVWIHSLGARKGGSALEKHCPRKTGSVDMVMLEDEQIWEEKLWASWFTVGLLLS